MNGKPEDIPQDVWEAAEGVAAEIGCRWRHDTTVIAQVILAERKRCADVALTVSVMTYASPSHAAQLADTRQSIHDAILAGAK